MLRSLIVAPNLPYPAFSGVDLRNWQNVNSLKKLGRVGVFGLCNRDPQLFRIAPPELEFYRTSSDPMITYPPPQNHTVARHWLEDPLGHPNDFYYSEIAAAELERILTEFKPEFVVLEGLWTHRYLDLLRSYPCKLALDLHDASFPLAQQLGQLTAANGVPKTLAQKLLPERVRSIEQHATATVDQLWVCSQREALSIAKLYQPVVSVHVVPNTVNADYYGKRATAAAGTTQAPKTLIFTALFGYPPNQLAANFLIEEIFPRLTEIAHDTRLVLPGNQPTARMIEAARNEPRIVVTGAVPDIRPYLHESSALIVPLFHGSGTRIKILEAFAAALPVVSTAKGAEGLDVEHPKHLLLAERADEFIDAVQRIWREPALVERLTANGLELIKEKYSWQVADRAIAAAVQELGLAA